MMSDDINKPQPKQAAPKGITPRHVIDQLRMKEIVEAVLRYAKTGSKIPVEWAEELVQLVDKKEVPKNAKF